MTDAFAGSRLRDGKSPRVIVIGAGIVGVCCASYLLRDGCMVTLLDPLGPGEGTSKGNAGALSPGSCVPLAMPGVFKKIPGWLFDPDGPLSIRPSYFLRALPWLLRFSAAAQPHRIAKISDALRALHSHTFECYEPLVASAFCADLIRCTGSLVVYETDQAFADSQREWQMRAARGAKFEVLRAPELRQLEPALSTHYCRGVLQSDHGFVANPQRLVKALAEAFVRDGGRLERRFARGFRFGHDNTVSVVTEDGEIASDHVVLSAGAWSRDLAASLGVRMPLESQRGYHVSISDPGVGPRLPVSSSEGKFYATPMEGGLRFAGTVEFAGLKASPEFRRARVLLGQAKTMYPGIDTSIFTEWMGHRPCLPDSLPVIGPTPRHPRVLFAFGHGHNGMTSGPVTGRIVADLVAGRQPFIDIKPYEVSRFRSL